MRIRGKLFRGRVAIQRALVGAAENVPRTQRCEPVQLSNGKVTVMP